MSGPFAPQLVETPRQRLVEAAIREIERRGLSQLTVRAVAAAAQMNIAAVNYHFRSKQALVDAALESTVEHMLGDTDQILARLTEEPQGVLAELFTYYLEGALRYPRICKAHLHDAFVADDYGGAFPRLFAPALLRLRDALRSLVPGLDQRQAERRVVASLSAVFFPAFFPGLYRGLGTLANASERREYAADVARRSLAPTAARDTAARDTAARDLARPARK
jgi:TetR/AcrR family transcriptional regulator, regulator of cefoperazone and chloramphenicol sensitivity